MLKTNRNEIDQAREALVDALATEQVKDMGLLRSLEKLAGNQRLTGNDYRRLTLAVKLAMLMVHEKYLDLQEAAGESDGK